MAAHHSPVKTVQRGVYDQLRIDWVQHFQSISLDSKRRSRLQKEVQIETTTEETSLRLGWALHQPKDGQTRFSDKIRGYLQKKVDMRDASNTDGTRMFVRMEWLSKLQIQVFFSRLSAKRKQSDAKETSNDDNEPDDNEELAEEYASLTDEHMLEKTKIAVQSEIGVKHLVMYDVCNLFEVAFESRLLFFKAEIRRGMFLVS